MRKNESLWYLSPTRQSVFAILFIIINVVKALVRGLWPLLVLVLFKSGNYERSHIILGLAVLGVGIVLAAIAFFWRFYFYVDGAQLHVEKGILRRSKVDIPFDRIQSVELQQPLLHRLAGVCKVKIDTAGSSGEEFSFNALSTAKAAALQEYIQRHRHQDQKVASPMRGLSNEIVRLDLGQLLRIGISQNHIRTAGLILFFGSGLLDQLEDVLGEQALEKIKGVGSSFAEDKWFLAALILGALLLLSFVGTLLRTILRYYDFVLLRRGGEYVVSGGLLNRYEHVIPDRKVQYVQWTSNPIKKMFKMVRLRFYQASSNVLSAAKAITVPGCSYDQLDLIRKEHFGERVQSTLLSLKVQRSLFWRRWLLLGIIPFLLFLGVFLYNAAFVYFFLAAVWLGLSYWYQEQYQRSWEAELFDQTLWTSSGVIERTTHLVKQFKIQGVRLATSPYLRRKGLATVVLFTASGKLKIPYLRQAEASQVKDFLLHQIETHRGAWM